MVKKILLCEDSTFFAQAISTILKSQGYDVTIAPDGSQGINILTQQKDFSLILCDIMMPNTDGFGVLQFVRSDAALMNMPFIFLTGVSDQDSMFKAQDQHVTDYFIKSNVGMDKILELVQKYIGTAQ